MSDQTTTGKTGWTTSLIDIISTLTWPRLFEATRLGLRPARLGLGVVMIVLIGLIGQLPRMWLGENDGDGPLAMAADRAGLALDQIAGGMIALNHVLVGDGLAEMFFKIPRDVVTEYPWSTLAIILPIILIWTVGGGAMARMAATEFALDRGIGWTKGLAFALSRWGSLFSSMAAPIAVFAGLIGVMACVGYVMLAIPYLQVVGAALFILALLAAAVGVVILVGFLLGAPMLVPAVACEGTDAIDAIQRTYAYVTARPLRILLYWAVLLIQAIVVTIILSMLAGAIVSLASWATTLFLGDNFQHAILEHVNKDVVIASSYEGSQRATIHVLGFWAQIPRLLVAAFVVSFWFCGGTIFYLLMRHACDGQDPEDLWTPGTIAGTAPASGTEVPDEVEDE